MRTGIGIAVLLVAVGCGRERIAVSGTVVGSAGLPVEGATVVVVGHPAATTRADGRFSVPDVVPPYDLLVGVTQPAFDRAFAAAWLGLRTAGPWLALDNDWPQVDWRSATVCGTTTGDVTFPGTAPWVLTQMSAPRGGNQVPGHVDPRYHTFCTGGGWAGADSVAAAVHVLAVDSGPYTGSDFAAVAFPAAGSLRGLALADGSYLTGVEVPLAPAPAAPLVVAATGPGTPGLFVAAYYGDGWPFGGVPLAYQGSGPPWPSVSVPLLPDLRVRMTVWWSDWAVGASWRERSVAPAARTERLALPPIPTPLEPAPGGAVAAGTRFRWTPAQADAVHAVSIVASASVSTPYTGFAIYAASPDLGLPDFAAVGVSIPRDTTGTWDARSVGPISGIDALVAEEHLGLAFHNGWREDEWFTAVSAGSAVVFGP